MMSGLDIIDVIERAATNPDARAIAAGIFAASSKVALENEHSRTSQVRASDAGRCALDLWAELKGLHDVDVDVETQLTRFDLGTLYGAWLGALLKAQLELEGYYEVVLEQTIERNGVIGHADALVYEVDDHIPAIAVEFKSTYSTKLDSPDARRSYQIIQVTNYALSDDFPVATVVTIAPAAFSKNGSSRLRADDYDPQAWAGRVDAEYARLSSATHDGAPNADPDFDWRCASCKYSGCARNKNPQALVVA